MKIGSAAGSLLGASALAVLIGGCSSMAPEYVRPDAPIPSSYEVFTAVEPIASARQALYWRDFFIDPVLQQLIAAALDNNRDLRKALLQVEEARAAYGIQRSERLPSINVGGQGSRARIPADLSPTGRSVVGSEYRAEVGLASWELDLWGRVRNLEQSALESWLATDAASQAVQTMLVGEVADAYLVLRELDQRVAVTRETVASRERSYQIFQRRYAVGATARLEVTQVQTLLTQAQTMLAQLELQHATQRNALRLLVGDAAMLLLQAESRMPELASTQPGLPSDLLTRRPDIVAAEHSLRAANANIGAARAAYLPRIALTGSFGTASAELDSLFGSGSKAWTFMPAISLPIFDGGRRRASLELSQVRRDMAVNDYQQSIQNAFRDVADALAARHWLAEQYEIQQVARDAQAERARLAQLRYDNGSAAYLEVLDAQRDLLDAEQQLIGTRRAVLSSKVSLYSALGGGYAQPATPNTPSSSE